ncbi:MAG TPA: hypothetical protein DHV36_03815 [Desulfobacteraceae bacterium]|nr:hypothetical protein [Desulfobacteraceae bacterium]
MSMVEEQDLFLQHLAKLVDKAHELGLVISAGELYRTAEQQKAYVKTGRSTTMNSQHLKRLAFDLNFFIREPDGSLTLTYDNERVRQLGVFWESLDGANRWGGNWQSFKDTPHFERREGMHKTAEKKDLTKGKAVTQTKGSDLITGTVGYRCDNHRDDVELVQRLLNINADRFSEETQLTCDGIYGKNTKSAITAFEEAILGESGSDSRICPGDSVMQALCERLPAAVDATFLELLYLAADESAIETFSKPITDCMAAYQINTPLRMAHFLAQIGHESGELRFREELASGRAYEGRNDLGNTRPGDGPRYKGRGLIQLTGRANYKRYTETNRFDKDVINEPDLVATEDEMCVDVAGWFWDRHKLNGFADQDQLEQITRKINGGLNGLAHRRRLLVRAKSIFGIS